jgi:beta-galactosidase
MPEVSFDSRALTIAGRRILLLSGAIHYSRCEPAEWPALFRSLRDADCDTVETYVNWHLHEPVPGRYDFDGRMDLRAFLLGARDAGLNVILRVGPYICGEQNLGGIPSWVLAVPGMEIRTWNAPWMEVSERWLRHLWARVGDLSAREGGPIILFQVENEFGNISEQYGEDGKRYIAWCAELGRSLDCGVPLIMCLGGTPGVLETINAWRPHEHLAQHWAHNPDQPAICTEHWSGWYDLWGFPRHLRPADEYAYAALRFLAGGATGMNYFLWHGGNNLGREPMYLQVPSYDFDAPIDRWARKTLKYHHLAAMHRALREVEGALLAGERPTLPAASDTAPVFRYGDATDEVLFLCNDHATERATRVYREKTYTLPPLSVKLLRAGRVIFDTHALPRAVAGPEYWPALPNTLSWRVSGAVEPTPCDWPADCRTAVRTRTPEQQLPHTRDETDYCWYETTLVVGEDEAGAGELVLTRAADFVQVFIDGVPLVSGPLPLVEERGDPDGDGDAYAVRLRLDLAPGAHRVSVLCAALGLIKGDWMLGKRNMIHERKGLWGAVTWRGRELAAGWAIQPGLLGERLGVPMGATSPRGGWVDRAIASASGGGLRWWRTEFPRPDEPGPHALDLTGLGKGFAWLNGRPLTRYWLIDASTAKTPEIFLNWIVEDTQPGPTQRFYRLPGWMLRERNELVLIEELGGAPDLVRVVRVA